ncbi:uncharacterized protein BDW47DRAFT_103044 [Aspergillus candidus]|uniref:Uncharacterized protein n=1 Tax=Aspergillus candidus TaxID=41067 RepID=A0A2I2FFP3_ASPCN|nr:hypothetical protein BDW47DRAFT_103044 [Aspergillus candidus]PLB39431.1 hypothetical protein BDW47DRAFT_103044 [Aspergillus candidus]
MRQHHGGANSLGPSKMMYQSVYRPSIMTWIILFSCIDGWAKGSALVQSDKIGEPRGIIIILTSQPTNTLDRTSCGNYIFAR